jgi:hypothetical protein
MFPFIYYIDCEGNLWVPCNCRAGGNGAGAGYGSEVVEAAGSRAYRDSMALRATAANGERMADSCARRDYECIRPASESEKTMLQREQDFEKLLSEALEAIKRLERLHEHDLALAPGI